MVALVSTVAYLGLEARTVEVQCQITAGLPGFHLVGLADKAVNESRQRVQAALTAMGLAMPPKRITVNMSPADLPKEGSHYDLPIALALLAALHASSEEKSLICPASQGSEARRTSGIQVVAAPNLVG